MASHLLRHWFHFDDESVQYFSHPISDGTRLVMGYSILISTALYIISFIVKSLSSRSNKSASTKSPITLQEDFVLICYLWCFAMTLLVGRMVVPYGSHESASSTISLHINDVYLIMIASLATLSILLLLSRGIKVNNFSSILSLKLLDFFSFVCWLPIMNGMWDSTFDDHVVSLLENYEISPMFVLALLTNALCIIKVCIRLQTSILERSILVISFSSAFLLTIFSHEIAAFIVKFLQLVGLHNSIDIISESDRDISISIDRIIVLCLFFMGDCLLMAILNKVNIVINSKLDSIIDQKVDHKSNKRELNGLRRSIPSDSIELSNEQAKKIMEGTFDFRTLSRANSGNIANNSNSNSTSSSSSSSKHNDDDSKKQK